MVNADNGLQAELDPQAWSAEQAFRASRRAERARRGVRAAQRAAAASVDGSADSHERAANAYAEAAEHGDRRKDDCLEHAARHREFAQEDRQIADRWRRRAATDLMAYP